MPNIIIKRRVAQDIDPWGRVRHVLATNVEQDLYHYFVTQYDITNWNYSYNYSVHIIGNQYIYGIKTFGEFPVTPYDFPVYTYQVANKGYVDSTARLYVTFENLNNNGDVGTNSNQVAFGDHTHAGAGPHSHDNMPTDDQKDAMDTAELPSGINPFITESALSAASLPTEYALSIPKAEVLTIAVKNVIPDLEFAPDDNSLIVFPVGSVSDGTDWSLSTKTITWDEVTAGYDLEVGDIVTVSYSYSEVLFTVRPKVEIFTISVKNVIPDLAFAPKDDTLIVYPVGSVSDGTDWSISTKTITWDEVTAGYDLEVGDIVVVGYSYNDIEAIDTSRLNIQNIRRVSSSPYTITPDDDVVFVDTDGGDITINLPVGVNGVRYRIVNTGTSGNDVILVPDGLELLIGINSSDTLSDTESLIINFETTEGWY